MNDNHPPEPTPDPSAGGPVADESPATSTGGPLVLGDRAAANLIRTTTARGATVVDLDDDPTLRAAAIGGDRRYLAVDLLALDGPPELQADLVVLRWPRPGDPSWLTSAGEVFTAVSGLLAPIGHAAVLLDPTSALAYGITWTGTLLANATDAGLLLLQDIVCVHDVDSDDTATSQSPAPVTLRHRVLLVLATRSARHARP